MGANPATVRQHPLGFGRRDQAAVQLHRGPAAAGGAGARLPLESARAIETACYRCHLEVRGQFNLPSHHPVPEGNLSCVQCHSPHKGPAFAAGGTRLLAQNENCLQCHEAQQGPFVFEHDALREGCTTCHSPHGSINAKLLTERNSNLCLKCHFQQVKRAAAF